MPPPRLLRRTVIVVAVLLATLVLHACGPGIQLVDGREVQIVSPTDGGRTELPFTVRWKVKTGEGSISSFAVLIDRSPPRPSATLRSLFTGDAICKRVPTCPDEAYLRSHFIRRTSSTAVTIDRVPNADSGGRKRLHTATIIPLDRSGRRLGEAAWTVEFSV